MSLHDLAAKGLHVFDPETAHGVSLLGLKLGLGPRAGAGDPVLATTLAGLELPNERVTKTLETIHAFNHATGAGYVEPIHDTDAESTIDDTAPTTPLPPIEH